MLRRNIRSSSSSSLLLSSPIFLVLPHSCGAAAKRWNHQYAAAPPPQNSGNNINPAINQLPPLLRHAVSASAPQYQSQQIHAYQQGNYSSYPFHGQMSHESYQRQQQHQQQRALNNNNTASNDQQQNQQNNNNNNLTFADRVHAERQEFLEKGYFAIRPNHVSFVVCLIVTVLLIPDMFDNHLAETMRYQLLMKDTTLLEKRKMTIGQGTVGEMKKSSTAGESGPTKEDDKQANKKKDEKDDNGTSGKSSKK